MTLVGWLQILVFAGVIFAFTKPLGIYMYRVFEGERRPLDPVLGPLERGLYAVCGVDPRREQTWLHYAGALLAFSCFGMLVTYAILRLQALLPLNPQGMAAVSEHLAWNTAASFTTNTNWQSYGGESTLSYFSQMAALASHNFTSAASRSRWRAAWRASSRKADRARSATSGPTSSAPSCTCCCRCR